MAPPLGARHSPASPCPPFHPGVRTRPSTGCPAPPTGSLRTSGRTAAGAQPLVLGGVRAGGALAPGAEPRVGGVHLGQLLGAEALGVLGREDAGVHRSLPGRGPFRHPTPPVAGNLRAAAARVGAADPSRLHPQPSAPVNPGRKPACLLARALEAEPGNDPEPGRLTP